MDVLAGSQNLVHRWYSGEDRLNQIDVFECKKGGADQPFPYRRVPKFENAVRPANECWNERGTNKLRSVCKTSEASVREGGLNGGTKGNK